MKTHMKSNEIIVENGTAPLLALPQMKKFKKKQLQAIIAG
jgi:hypothetical protein